MYSIHLSISGSRSPSPERHEIENFVSQKNVFENRKDNWRANEINTKIQTERQKEMDLLMNRFKKPQHAGASEKTAFTQAKNFSGKT